MRSLGNRFEANVYTWVANTFVSRSRPGDRRHQDEVFLKIKGRLLYPPGALVDQTVNVMHITSVGGKNHNGLRLFPHRLTPK